jgi:ADP-ribosyl-[dinitrogen reductase] hydrolase
MISDDTEHACLAALALIRAGDPRGSGPEPANPADPDRFAGSLAWRLRGWFAALPAAVGFATLRACLKLWLGVSPRKSGVFSAGNGPAMRAPVLGACLAGDPERLVTVVRASTRLTHTDPRAEEGALAIALAAAHAVERGPDGIDAQGLLETIRGRSLTDELRRSLDAVAEHHERGAPAEELASSLGLNGGVTGYMLHTVPMALAAWLASPADVRGCVERIVRLGGDADSTGAIVGGLAGATAGEAAVPAEWLAGIWDWPLSIAWLRHLGRALGARFGGGSAGEDTGAPSFFWPALPLRNIVFGTLAVGHGLRRMLPPY